MKKIALAEYKIYLSEQLSEFPYKLIDNYSNLVALVDENTRAYCLPLLLDAVPVISDSLILEIPSGESFKQLETCEKLWQALFEQGIDRKALFINIGGGVIGDMGGLAASLYKRGIDFLNIPTTLLAQVDATVGGKLGIDFLSIKNGLGIFRNPKAIFIYPGFLKTLPDEQILSGFAEMLKHGLIADKRVWNDLTNINPKQQQHWLGLINTSLSIKKQIVEQDMYEQAIRKKLNFGHTIGHAVESYALSKGKPILHGHAVALGLLGEAHLSTQVFNLDEKEFRNIEEVIMRNYSAYFTKELLSDKVLDWMYHDKKNEKENFNFTLLKSIGKAEINCHCTKAAIRKSLDYLKRLL